MMSNYLQSNFEDYIKSILQIDISCKILLAVSGGVDSVVMTHLFLKAGYSLGIAHCNFQLRGDESDQDETFVKKLAAHFQIPFYVKRFNTKKFASDRKISIQMAARELRYQWFEIVRKENAYDYIATAHHKDDQIETYIFNIIRGTGISGLSGIDSVLGKIIRPLMFATRNEIEDYADRNRISFRNDSSNEETKYIRNKIRKEIIPLIKEINPSYQQVIIENIEKLKSAETIYRESISNLLNKILIKKENELLLPINTLKSLPHLKTYLFEWLSPMGFNISVVNDIVKALDDIPGKQFYSTTHRAVKDREFLIISKIPIEDIYDTENQYARIDEFKIESGRSEIQYPLNIKIERFDHSVSFEFFNKSQVAYFDLEKLKFPLIIRRWKKGDYFYPFGMKNKKKVSDYFIDQKFSLPEKEKTWLMCTEGEIIWIIGHRADNRFKIEDSTKKIIKMTLSST